MQNQQQQQRLPQLHLPPLLPPRHQPLQPSQRPNRSQQRRPPSHRRRTRTQSAGTASAQSRTATVAASSDCHCCRVDLAVPRSRTWATMRWVSRWSSAKSHSPRAASQASAPAPSAWACPAGTPSSADVFTACRRPRRTLRLVWPSSCAPTMRWRPNCPSRASSLARRDCVWPRLSRCPPKWSRRRTTMTTSLALVVSTQ